MRLANVRPLALTHSQADCGLMHAKRFSNRFVFFSSHNTLSDLANNVVRKFRVVVACAFLASMPSHIGVVLSGCSPMQIRERVVAGAAIAVQGFVSERVGANKRFQNESMDLPLEHLPVAHQRNELVSVLVAPATLELSPFSVSVLATWPRRPHRAIIGDSIAGKSNNVSIFGHWFIISNTGDNS